MLYIMLYTPGPWSFFNAYGKDPIRFLRLGQGNKTVLQACIADSDCIISRADALLLKSAPELLSVLENIEAYTHTVNFMNEHDNQIAKMCREAIKRIWVEE